MDNCEEISGGIWTPWDTLVTRTADASGSDTFNLSTYVPCDSVQIAWIYAQGAVTGWGMAIDNVQITTDSKLSDNLSVMSIDTPATALISPVVFNPTFTILNEGINNAYDYWTYFYIENGAGTPVYFDSMLVTDTLLSDSVYIAQFPSFTPVYLVRYTATAWISMPADTYYVNDTLTFDFRTYDLDVGCNAIMSPAYIIDPAANELISANFHNYATQTASFDAVVRIFDAYAMPVYDNFVRINALAAGADTIVDFPDWLAPHPIGYYTMVAYSRLSYDLDSSNDTISLPINTLNNEIFVFDDFSGFDYYQQAAARLGYSTMFSGDYTDIYNTDYKLIIINCYSNALSSDLLDTLEQKVLNGTKIILSSWDLYMNYPTHSLFNLMGVTLTGDTTTPINFFADDTTDSFFNYPEQIYTFNWTDNQYIRDCILCTLLPNGIKKASFDSDSITPAVVIDTLGMTIFNAFQAANFQGDDDGDGIEDVVELIMNEINLMYDPSGIPDYQAPYITYTSPANASVNVPVNDPVIIGFNEPIDTSAGFTFTCTPDPGLWTEVWNATIDTVRLVHSDFSLDVDYYIEITSAYDTSGWELSPKALPNPFGFSTGATGITDKTGKPEQFYISVNKNIINNEAAFVYSIPASGNVKVEIFNVLGDMVTTLVNDELSAGTHRLFWNLKNSADNDVSSGVYLYKITFGDKSTTGKLTLIK